MDAWGFTLICVRRGSQELGKEEKILADTSHDGDSESRQRCGHITSTSK
jgi:hypothetical protein